MRQVGKNYLLKEFGKSHFPNCRYFNFEKEPRLFKIFELDFVFHLNTSIDVAKDLIIFDVGILGSMIGLSPKTILSYEYGSYKGCFAENFVAQEILESGQEKLFSCQENKSELEFLIEAEGRVIPVEVKSSLNAKAKNLKVFSEKYKPFNSSVLQGFCNYPLYLAGKFLSFEGGN